MPPLQKKKKLQTTFQRDDSSLHLRSSLFLSQQTDLKGHLTDTLLICPEGKIPAHAFVLQLASQFFQNCFTSQGENYYYTREILLPDFPLQEIEQVMNLIYKGFVHLPDDISMSKFKQTLTFFQIAGVDLADADDTAEVKVDDSVIKLEGSLRVTQSVKGEGSSSMDIDVDTEGNSPPETPPPKLEAQVFASPQKYPPGSLRGPTLQRGRPPAKFQPVVKLPRLMFNVSTTPNKPEVAVMATPCTTGVSVPKPMVTGGGGGDLSKKLEPVGPCSEDEDEDWEVPNYKNVKWLRRESRRCQSCDEDFDTIAEAQTCARSHEKPLRCYFCFKVFSVTEKLFSHYKRRHKAAHGREDNLICPFCDNAVPNKNVSVHVISVHLSKGVRSGGGGGGVGRVGRPPTITSVPSSSSSGQGQRSREASASKEKVDKEENDKQVNKKKKKGVQMKLPNMATKWRQNVGGEDGDGGMLRLPNLDIRIEMECGSGRVVEFRLRKERDHQQNNNYNEKN